MQPQANVIQVVQKMPRPRPVRLQPLDTEQHFCSPENLERVLENTLELKTGIKLRDQALDGYERQLRETPEGAD